MTYEAGFEPIPQPANPIGFGKWYGKVFVPKDGDANAEATFAGILTLVHRTNWLAWRSIDIRSGGAYDTQNITINTGVWTFKDAFNLEDLRLTNGSWPLLVPERSWERHSLRIISTSHEFVDAGDVRFRLPDAWATNQPGFRCIETRPTTSIVQYTEIALDDLPDGGTLQGVMVTSRGIGLVASTLQKATYRVGRFKGTAATEWVSAEVVDVHVDADFTTPLSTTVYAAGNHIVDKSYMYFVRATHASRSGGTPGNPMYILDTKANGVAGRLGL